MTSLHIIAAEVRHQQKKLRREREIKSEQEEGKKGQLTQRERERAMNFFHDDIRLYNFKFSKLVAN